MLVIRQAQWEALRASREDDCVERLRGHLRESFPREISLLAPDAVEKVIRLGIARSTAHGLPAECDIYTYLTLMLMLGAHFDDDPQLDWVGARLQTVPGRAGDTSRIDKLHDDALHYLDRVAGVENEHLIRALVRVRAFDLASLRNVPPAGFEDHMLSVLDDIHPTKFAAQSEAATRTVIKRGAELGRQRGMPGNEGAGLLAGLGFLLGFGFDVDPQYPWVQAGLTNRAPSIEKTRELHRSALQFAEQSLGG